VKLTFGSLYDHVFIRFRRQRMNRFFALFAPSPEARVLDIGGTPQTWSSESGPHAAFPVTLINIRRDDQSEGGRFHSMEGEATALPFADDTFDIAFSNSVIEHVGTWEKQQAFAREARRVARKLWIQTPARSFPIEAHLLAPYIQYLPKKLQHRIVRWTPRGLLQPGVVHEIVDEVRLLTFREVQHLFPDCHILKERAFGLTKSYIAVRPGPLRGKLEDMSFSRSFIELHVRLLNDGTEVFRPTRALKLGGGLFKLVAPPGYDPADERWEHLPGATVRVELHHGVTGDFPIAVRP
jgi:hypothetical protein